MSSVVLLNGSARSEEPTCSRAGSACTIPELCTPPANFDAPSGGQRSAWCAGRSRSGRRQYISIAMAGLSVLSMGGLCFGFDSLYPVLYTVRHLLCVLPLEVGSEADRLGRVKGRRSTPPPPPARPSLRVPPNRTRRRARSSAAALPRSAARAARGLWRVARRSVATLSSRSKKYKDDHSEHRA